MKKTISLALFLFLLSNLSFSQESAIKSYPLKDYIAPEIKYRQFDLRTSLYSNGVNGVEINNQNDFSFNAGLDYLEYINTKGRQGNSNGYLYTDFSSSTRNKDSVDGSSNNLRIDLGYGTQNRFYFNKKIFLGIHGDITYKVNTFWYKSGEDNYEQQSHLFTLTPYISVGKGRVEPVESARRAMDILISLEKYNRLSTNADTSMIDSLARVANRIRYKRFFDNRFKKIYQLEELDQAIQNLDLVDSLDIVYFANLNDIWNFAPNFSRGSGTRIEGGLIPDIQKLYSKPQENKYKSSRNGIYGFFSFNRMRPISYAWQSNLMIDLTFGYSQRIYSSELDESKNENKYENLKSLLNASWQFGFFPNTRTYAGLTPYTGLSFDRSLESSSNIFGVISGVKFHMYYYVSPRLRLTFYAMVTYSENFDPTVPTPFWNSVIYSSPEAGSASYMGDVVTFPIETYYYGGKQISYQGSVTLSYAIF